MAVDAVRFLSVAASGATAVHLQVGLHQQGVAADLLLGLDASPQVAAERYLDRTGLEAALKRWIGSNPSGVVVMSAAVNDYQVAQVLIEQDGGTVAMRPGTKLPSRAGAVTVRLEPASKLIDQFRGWGLSGPIVGFKYEAKETVVASAAAQQHRVGAAVVVANSLCGQVQALVDEHGSEHFHDRPALIAALGARLGSLARH